MKKQYYFYLYSCCLILLILLLVIIITKPRTKGCIDGNNQKRSGIALFDKTVQSFKAVPYTFNVLIATVGRPTLQAMLDSLCGELVKEDCLTIVFDGHTIIPLFDVSKFKCKVVQFCEPVALGYWGHAIQNKYTPLLEKRDFVMYADDDDAYIKNSFNNLRKLIKKPDVLYIAKMIYKDGRLIPRIPTIEIANISTQNGIIPYDLAPRGTFGYTYVGDGEYYIQISKLAPVEFLDLVIYKIRP